MNKIENKYYTWWKDNKPCLSLIPAIVFWVVSMIFFIIGLNFKNPIMLFGIDFSLMIAVALSLANTVIQIIGNDQEKEGLGLALWIGWIGSYMLGIGTNVVGLLSILAIDHVLLEWVIAIGLGTMIEVLPERLVVQFLKTMKPKKSQQEFVQNRKPSKSHRPYPPKFPTKQLPPTLSDDILKQLRGE